jgi:YHS domain-containing protein
MYRTRWLSSIVLALLLAASMGTANAGTLERVAPDRVCMVNDTRHPGPQIPVVVDGKTYFGCCEMCKGRLASDPQARTAVDPTSGKTVDKATAVIGATPQGKVMYFESAASLDAYAAKP